MEYVSSYIASHWLALSIAVVGTWPWYRLSSFGIYSLCLRLCRCLLFISAALFMQPIMRGIVPKSFDSIFCTDCVIDVFVF